MSRAELYETVDRLYSPEIAWEETVTYGSKAGLNVAQEALAGREESSETAIRIADFETGETESYTFRDLEVASNRFANYLEEHTDRHDRVGAVLPETIELHAVLYGTVKAGRIFVPVSPLLDEYGTNYRLDDADTRVIVTDEDMHASIDPDEGRSLESLVLVDGDLTDVAGVDARPYDDVREYASAYDPVVTHPNDVYSIAFTSGTTGDPKGCTASHGGFVRKTYPHLEYAVGLDADSVYMTSGSPTTRPSRTFGTHIRGATIAYYRGAFDPERLLDTLESFGITSLHIPPTGFRQLRATDVDFDGYDFDLDSLTTGGESLDAESIEWARGTLGAAPQEGYGLTEIGMVLCNYAFDDWEIKPGSLGRPLPGVEIDVVTTDGDPVERGEVGELVVKRSPDAAGWYWGKPGKSVTEFGGPWHHTGDLVRQDEDGYVWYRCRRKSAIEVDGTLVPPEEVEATILRHDAVAEVGVVGVPDPESGERVRAVVTTIDDTDGSAALESDLHEFARSNLSANERPREIEFVDDLPKTATGKIRRSVL